MFPGANWFEGKSTDRGAPFGPVISSGTPTGTGMERQEFLKPGDTISIEIEGIGKIETPFQTHASQVR